MTRFLSITTWGLFCACSWTWCIGMFLPHVLLDRFGWPGFALFAVVNVLGCSLFGYVIGDRARSQASVERHGRVMGVFSLVTIAFHLYFTAFLVAMFAPGDPAAWWPALAAVLLLGAGYLLSFAGDDTWPVLAVITWIFSATVFARIGLEPLTTLPSQGAEPTTDLLFLGPVIAAGFLLCPYFDLTFHRALQRSGSRHTFAVFGATFAVMLLLSVAYWPLEPGALPRMVAAHLLVQSLFTVAAHLRELRLSGPAAATSPTRRLPLLVILLAAILPAYAISDIEQGRDVYLRFTVFYGLVFPAYGLAFMGRRAAPTARAIITLLVVIVLMTPFYELAFIGGPPVWLAVPVGAVIIWWVARSGVSLAVAGRR